MRLGAHEDNRTVRTRAAFLVSEGETAASIRADQIAALPSKEWRGVQVYRLTCAGPYGRGPHEVWVPEGVLWALIDLGRFLCPFHR